MVQLIVKNKISEIVEGFNIGNDFKDALNEEVKTIIEKAGVRANNNGRKTIQAKDL